MAYNVSPQPKKPQSDKITVERSKLVEYINRVVDKRISEASKKIETRLRRVISESMNGSNNSIQKPRTEQDIVRAKLRKLEEEKKLLERKLSGKTRGAFDDIAEAFTTSPENDDPDDAIINQYVNSTKSGARNSGLISPQSSPVKNKIAAIKSKAKTQEEKIYAEMLETTPLNPMEMQMQSMATPQMPQMGYQGNSYGNEYNANPYQQQQPPNVDPSHFYKRVTNPEEYAMEEEAIRNYQSGPEGAMDEVIQSQNRIDGIAEAVVDLNQHSKNYQHGYDFVDDELQMIKGMQNYMAQSAQQQAQQQR